MAELQVSKRGQLSDCAQPFDKNENYLKILRFGDEALKTELCEYIDKRNKNAIYNNACGVMKSSAAQMTFLKGAELFKSISGFRDADALAAQCLEKAESCRKDAVYTTAISRMAVGNTASYKQAIAIFKTIPGWRDANSQIYACQKRIEEIKAQEEAARLEALRKAEEKRIAAAKRAKRLKKFAAIATPVLCVCIAFVIVLCTVIIPQQKYNKAMNLLESGDYDSAYALLEEISDNETIASSKYDRAIKCIDSGDYESAYILLKDISYKDSKEKCANIKTKYNRILMRKAAVGNKITFGTYEQDNDTSNGAEDIEWLVLAKENNKILVISDKALDCQRYNAIHKEITWEQCSLRKWLNDSFLNTAFSEEERALIQSTTVSADKNPQYQYRNPGNATTDKVFLLSINEVEKYFSDINARECSPTAYAKAQGARTGTYNGVDTCAWWLRSPGSEQSFATSIDDLGWVNSRGYSVSSYVFSVRPALWIDLDSMKNE